MPNQLFNLFEDDTARSLGGIGAALTGNLPQFQEQERRRDLQLDQDRRDAMLKDAFTVQRQLQQGDTAGAISLLQNRSENIQQLGGDPGDTLGLLSKLQSGNVAGALNDVSTVVEFGRAQGLLNIPQPKQQIIDGQLVSVDPSGSATASPIEGFTRDPGRQQDRDLRERQISVAEQAEQRQKNKLSAGLEKALLTSGDRVVEAQRQANEFDVLANDFERLNLEGGLSSTVSESFKTVLGTQDDVTEFRRRFNKVRLSEGLRNLPPGPATDRDVKEAFKGVPKESASAEQVASFLRGAAKLARFEAGFNQFKGDFISKKRTGAGINNTWRSKINSPVLKKDVTVAEVYQTAQSRGVSPEEVLQRLGIEKGLFDD